MGLCASLGEKVKMGPDGVREFHLSNKKEVSPEISHYIHMKYEQTSPIKSV